MQETNKINIFPFCGGFFDQSWPFTVLGIYQVKCLSVAFCALAADLRFNEEISISDKWSYVNLWSILKSARN